MKKHITPILLLFIITQLFISCGTQDQKTQSNQKGVDDSLKVLAIGNSFSNNATKFLNELAVDGNKKLRLSRASIGGASLQRHWDALQIFKNYPDSSKGRPYSKNRSLDDFLVGNQYDIVTIQQVSILSCDTSEYRPYARNMYDYIKKHQPNAEVVFHQTWAYRSDARRYCQIEEGVHAQSDEEMWENSRRSYHTIASELGVRIIPVGDAFWEVCSGENGYQAVAFEEDSIQEPDLPAQKNSIHRGYFWRDGELRMDANHANQEGCLLGGLVWYGFLFEESPEKLTFVPEGSDSTFVSYLRAVAAGTLKKVAP